MLCAPGGPRLENRSVPRKHSFPALYRSELFACSRGCRYINFQMMPKSPVSPDDRLRKAARDLSRLRKRPCLLFVAWDICEHRTMPVKVLIEKCRSKALDFVVDSPGGDLNAAYVILRELRRRFPQLAAYVPLYAKSAATLLCLGADELILGELGELGPLDTQLEEKQRGDFPRTKSCLERFKTLEQLQRHAIETFNVTAETILGNSGMRPADACTIAADFAAKLCGPMYGQIEPDSLGQDARYLAIGQEYAERIVRRYRPDLIESVNTDSDDIIQALVSGYPAHDFVIDLEELADLGLPARGASKEEAPILDEFAVVLSDLRSVLGESSHEGLIELIDASSDARSLTQSSMEENPARTTQLKLHKG